MAVIAPAEADAIVLDVEQTAIGDGDAVGIAAEIGEHLFGAAKRRFGVDVPLLAARCAEAAAESGRFGEPSESAEEAQRAGLKRRPKRVEEESAEEAREDAHRQEEAGAAGDPAGPVG